MNGRLYAHIVGRTAWLALALAMMAPAAQAEVITNVLAKAFAENTGGSYDRHAAYAVNGIGLTGDAHSNVANGTMWQGGASSGWFRVYLNRECFVEKIRVWNYNEGGPWSKRGARLADLYTAVDPGEGGVGWSLLAQDYEFTKAPGLDTYNTPDEIDVNRKALYLHFNIKSAWSSDNMVGLSEVQIIGTPVNTILLTNVTATAYSEDTTYDREAVWAVNGAGLSGLAHAWSEDHNMWLSASGTQGWFQVDLHGLYTLREIAAWNYNNASFLTRGTKHANIYVATSNPGSVHPGEGAPWVEIVSNQYFAKAPGASATYDTPTRVIMNDKAAYVGFEILSSHGGNRIGFSELQFRVDPPMGTLFMLR